MGLTVRADAPVRVADVGGWTDTWFGSPGRVCHVAVRPGVEVRVEVVEASPGVYPVKLEARSIGASLRVGPDPEEGWARPRPGIEPLLEHAVASVLERCRLPEGVGLEIDIVSSVPPGASLGTSAAVVVALLAALDSAVGDGTLADDPVRLATEAHQVETVRAGRQAGVQDQWAAAFGGAGLLSVNPYPSVRRVPVGIAPEVVSEFDERLVTVVFARHDSSAVHERVVTDMTTCSSEGHDRARRALRRLSELAGDAASALAVGDLQKWGAVLTEATDRQRELGSGLVGEAHETAIAVARDNGAYGWKVNGAGGSGGSLTVLAVDSAAATRLRDDLEGAGAGWRLLDHELARSGVQVTLDRTPGRDQRR